MLLLARKWLNAYISCCLSAANGCCFTLKKIAPMDFHDPFSVQLVNVEAVKLLQLVRLNTFIRHNTWIAFEPPTRAWREKKMSTMSTHMTKGAELINRKQKYIKTHSNIHLAMSAFITNEPSVVHSCVNAIATTTFYIWLKFAIKFKCLRGRVRAVALWIFSSDLTHQPLTKDHMLGCIKEEDVFLSLVAIFLPSVFPAVQINPWIFKVNAFNRQCL